MLMCIQYLLIDGFKERFKEMIKSLNSALSLVALKLKNHGNI